MSKPWLKIYSDLFEHEKTLLVSETLKTEPLYVGAHLISLWTWAINNRPDGKLKSMTQGQIALAAKWKGDPQKFLSALQSANFIESDLSIRNWERYAGKLLQWRAANKTRMQLDRACKKAGVKVNRQNFIRSGKSSMEEKRRAALDQYYQLHPTERPKDWNHKKRNQETED